MNNKSFIVVMILLIVSVLSLVSVYKLMDGVYWQLVAQTESPDSQYSTYEYNYASDSNRHAPYGRYIFLQSSDATNHPSDGYLIFAGYCDNEQLVSWVNDKKLKISCESRQPGSIKTQSLLAYGLMIEVNSVNEHNN